MSNLSGWPYARDTTSAWRVTYPMPEEPTTLGLEKKPQDWHSAESTWHQWGASLTPTVARTEELLAKLRAGHAPGGISAPTMFAGRAAAPGKTLPEPTSAQNSLAMRRRIWDKASSRVEAEGPERMFNRLARPKRKSRPAFGKELAKWSAQYGGASITTSHKRLLT